MQQPQPQQKLLASIWSSAAGSHSYYLVGTVNYHQQRNQEKWLLYHQQQQRYCTCGSTTTHIGTVKSFGYRRQSINKNHVNELIFSTGVCNVRQKWQEKPLVSAISDSCIFRKFATTSSQEPKKDEKTCNSEDNGRIRDTAFDTNAQYVWDDPFLYRDTMLTDTERSIQNMANKFCQEELMQTIVQANRNEIYCNHTMMKQFGQMGFLGCTLPTKYGCAGLTYVPYGLITTELERVDSSYRSAVSVQSSLVMYPIYQYAQNDKVRNKYLPELASGNFIGCFGLTEPNHGSDPSSMETKAIFDAGTNEYILNGTKTWITNSPIADVFVIWAKTVEPSSTGTNKPSGIKGYIIDRNTPGLTTPKIDGKFSLRASITGSIIMEDVRVPAEHQLNVVGLKGPFSCLNHARFGISWGVLGAAEACMNIARTYTIDRKQFNKPLASNQLIQKKLADMVSDIATSRLSCIQVGRLMESGRAKPEMISLIKRQNCNIALTISRIARDMLGANGISDEYHIIRHLLNLESVNTYEGTSDIHALILGRSITGISAF